jgi:hypothetical protein
MFPVRCLLFAILCVSASPAVPREHAELVSDPASWSNDFRNIVQSTEQCAGGTLDDLRGHMHVTGPYSPKEYRAVDRSYLEFATGVQDYDLIYSFYYSAQSKTGRYWGFGGYVVVRDTCIVHADIDGYDN